MNFLATLNDFPGWIITVVLAMVGYAITAIIWLIRLEGKINLMSRELENAATARKGLKEDIDEVCEKVEKTRAWVGTHVGNEDAHLGKRLYDELVRRFDSQDKRLERIESKIDAR